MVGRSPIACDATGRKRHRRGGHELDNLGDEEDGIVQHPAPVPGEP
jgi:hypothetical protein